MRRELTVSEKILTARLALGTVQFGLNYGIANTAGQVSAVEARAILNVARAGGINTLDTAIAYGESEAALGVQGVSEWNIVTKLPELPPDVQASAQVHGWVQSQVSVSLARLGVNSVHAILLHRPDQMLGSQGEALLSALLELKLQGLTANVGVSIYRPQELETITQVFQPDLVQAPLSILDTSLVTSGWAARLKNAGSEIHVRSAFLQGLLLMNENDRPAKFARWNPLWRQWLGWLQEHQLTPLQACLRYSLSVQQADKVIVGVDTASQLNEILDAAQGPLPPVPKWNMPIDADLVNPANWNQL
jgi:aryl-alcohol dehydrogenase-like predicted oxidoreductase